MISSTGQFWQKNDTQQMAYLQTLISHHQKKQRFSADNRNTMLNDYQNLQQTLQQQNRATQSSSTAQATT
ncbi:MAG: hypothetical protein HRU20_26355 [Pseudomonadales bacterium]|nr:hypothetical protein [Pseudomonadales bacterium]